MRRCFSSAIRPSHLASRAPLLSSRRWCSAESAGESTTSGKSTFDQARDVPGQMGVGMVILGGGIVVININERRAAKQDILNEFAEKRIASINTDSCKENEVDGKLIHAHGDVRVTEPFPRDDVLGVEVRGGKLRLRRDVEMYQYEESKNKNEKTGEVTYSYTKKWSHSHISTHDNRNPEFPHMANTKEAGALHVIVSAAMELLLSKNFVQRLTDWTPTAVEVTSAGAADGYRLEMNADKTGFYTRGHSPSNPEIGDIRVQYKTILPGAHTIMGKLGRESGAKAVVPYSATLSKSLLAEADVIVPDEAKKLAEDAGAGPFVIPEWVGELAEKFVLSALPIEFAHVARGREGKDEAVKHHREDCNNNTEMMYYGGALMCVVGGLMLASPVGLVSSSAQFGTGLTTGMGIAHTSRKNAKAQLDSQIKQPAPQETSGSVNGDVKL